MDFRLLSQGEQIAAVSGAALFVFLFTPWLDDANAWAAFRWVHLILAVIAIVAVAIPVLKAAGSGSPFRGSPGNVLATLGLIAFTITASMALEGEAPNFLIVLPLIASAGVLYGGVIARDQGERAPRRERPRRAVTAEDLEHPPPGMESWRARSWATDEFEEGPSPRRGAGTASAGEGAAATGEPFEEDEEPMRRERRARERDAGEREERPSRRASESTEVRRTRTRPEREPEDS